MRHAEANLLNKQFKGFSKLNRSLYGIGSTVYYYSYLGSISKIIVCCRCGTYKGLESKLCVAQSKENKWNFNIPFLI